MIILGGIAPYFVIKRYTELKRDIETRHHREADRLRLMSELGGYHTWVAWVAAILVVLSVVGLIISAMLGIIATA